MDSLDFWSDQMHRKLHAVSADMSVWGNGGREPSWGSSILWLDVKVGYTPRCFLHVTGVENAGLDGRMGSGNTEISLATVAGGLGGLEPSAKAWRCGGR